jgi:hypothetical protein
MWRRAFIFVAALSLVLFVAMAALWVRSYFVADAVAGCVSETPRSEVCVQAWSNYGSISLRRFDLTLSGATAPPPGYRLRDGLHFDVGQKQHWKTGDAGPWGQNRFHHLLGFRSHDGTYRRRLPDVTMVERDRGIALPHWLPMVLAAAAPALWWRQRRKRRMRRHAGLCEACGYDLCATPQRCPECGAVPGGAAATAGAH